jgi:hypothetical protein
MQLKGWLNHYQSPFLAVAFEVVLRCLAVTCLPRKRNRSAIIGPDGGFDTSNVAATPGERCGCNECERSSKKCTVPVTAITPADCKRWYYMHVSTCCVRSVRWIVTDLLSYVCKQDTFLRMGAPFMKSWVKSAPQLF